MRWCLASHVRHSPAPCIVYFNIAIAIRIWIIRLLIVTPLFVYYSPAPLSITSTEWCVCRTGPASYYLTYEQAFASLIWTTDKTNENKEPTIINSYYLSGWKAVAFNRPKRCVCPCCNAIDPTLCASTNSILRFILLLLQKRFSSIAFDFVYSVMMGVGHKQFLPFPLSSNTFIFNQINGHKTIEIKRENNRRSIPISFAVNNNSILDSTRQPIWNTKP